MALLAINKMMDGVHQVLNILTQRKNSANIRSSLQVAWKEHMMQAQGRKTSCGVRILVSTYCQLPASHGNEEKLSLYIPIFYFPYWLSGP